MSSSSYQSCHCGHSNKQKKSNSPFFASRPIALQTQASASNSVAPPVTSRLQAQIDSLSSGGAPLPETVRSFFEPRFGYDFSQVRLHTGTQAGEMAQSVNARAFTVGQNVVFGAGQYSPATTEGKKLLAHELVHTQQQSSHAAIRPKLIQRTEATQPSPVVIVSGSEKIPDMEEDAVEKIVRTAGAKQDKAGNYRFVPVSGYADFVAKAHQRLTASECASKVLISGHGGSNDNSAWQVIGSVTDPKRGWGTTDIGNSNDTLIGADVLKNIRFCSPCIVEFMGCNFSATKPGMKFMQEVANSTRCTVYAYAGKTTPNPETGFPEPFKGDDKKKPGHP